MDKKKDKRQLQEGLYRVIRFLALPFMTLLFKAETDKEPVLPAPFIVVSNHVSDFDFYYPAKVFRQPLGFVVGEGLLQNKWLRKLLIDGLGCISKQKATKDGHTTISIFRRLQKGRNVCLFVEGNTTFDGVTGPFPPATGKLLGMVNAGLVTLRIEGGYFLKPRWGKGLRRGKTACRVVNTYTKEQLKSMSAEEINVALARDLYEDAYLRQEKKPETYRGKTRAEGIEHAVYLCPNCKTHNSIKGEKHAFDCKACGAKASFTQTGHLEGDFTFKTLRDWLRWQKEELRQLAQKVNGAILTDDDHTLLVQTERGHLEHSAQGQMCMNLDKLVIGEAEFALSDIAGLEIYRKNVLQFSTKDGQYYQTGKKDGFNALKYRDLYDIVKAGE